MNIEHNKCKVIRQLKRAETVLHRRQPRLAVTVAAARKWSLSWTGVTAFTWGGASSKAAQDQRRTQRAAADEQLQAREERFTQMRSKMLDPFDRNNPRVDLALEHKMREKERNDKRPSFNEELKAARKELAEWVLPAPSQQKPVQYKTDWRVKCCPDTCEYGQKHWSSRDGNACHGLLRVINAYLLTGDRNARPQPMRRR